MKIYRALPDPVQIAPFLAAEQAREFTYTSVGQTANPDARVTGFDHDRQRVAVGSGADDFERAKDALRAWVHFPAAWTRILPENAPFQPGVTVAMFFRLFGFWWRNSCRIVYRIDEAKRFGFAYGTLPAHIERGEEVFFVELDEDGTVWYELRAFSRPGALLARLGYPLVRLFQEKFRQDSALAVQRFVCDKGPENEPTLPPDKWFLRILLFVFSAAWLWPGSLMGHDYGKLPLAFAMLLVVPAGLLLTARHFPAKRPALARLWPFLLPAVLAATVSLGLPGGWIAGLLMLPWVAVCGWVAALGVGLMREGQTSHLRASKIATSAGLINLLIGGLSGFADRMGYHPFGFGDDIIRLTALHFHYAGFAIPVLAGVAALFSGGFWPKIAAWSVALGVPFTALGITATQLHFGPFLETFAAGFMASAALLSGVVFTGLGGRRHNVLLFSAGLILCGSMVLALSYGLRVIFPGLALSLDWMRALHGSLNGFVAVPLGLLGMWWLGWETSFARQ